MLDLVLPFVGALEYNNLQLGFRDKNQDIKVERLIEGLGGLSRDIAPACLFRKHRHFEITDEFVPVWRGEERFTLSAERFSSKLTPVTFSLSDAGIKVLEYVDMDATIGERVRSVSAKIGTKELLKISDISTSFEFERHGLGITFLPYFFTGGNLAKVSSSRFMEKELASDGAVSSTVVEKVDELPEQNLRAPTVWCPQSDNWLLVSGCGCFVNKGQQL